MPKYLTDRSVNALTRKPANAGKRYDVLDTAVPGFGVRVNERGEATFFLATRYPGSQNPARRTIGRLGAVTLAEAREVAKRWREMVARGVDPQAELARERQANERRRVNTFEAVVEDFIAEKLATERKGKEVERDIRRDLIPKLGHLGVTDVGDDTIAALIKEKAKTAPGQARNLLGIIKRFFQWAYDQRAYGLKASPAAMLKPRSLCGERTTGSRILSDVELFALWRATAKTPYPHGSVYRLLLLTALRLNEGADASKKEIDRANGIWTIPAARMKGRNGKARPHVVPLTTDVIALFDELPTFDDGDFLFSTTLGESPVWITDKVKKRIDARMLRTMRALARCRGEDPRKIKLEPWVNHDLRRTVRSNLSKLKVAEEVREAVLAHARPGIKGTYDHHDYLDEKREALELWAARLRTVVSISATASSNVILWKSPSSVVA